jgi:ribosomal protein L29
MHCKTMMSLEWCKSFGIREFDKEMVEKELFEGCEEVHLHQFNMQMQATLAHCPNVGKFSTILYSFFDSPH